MSCNCTEEEREELGELRVDLAAVRAALRAILSDGTQQYSLDTSQTRIMVTKANIASIRDLRRELMSDIAALEAKCEGTGGAARVVPAW